MKTRKQALGTLGSIFFSWAQMRQREIVVLGDLQESLNISKHQEVTLLQRLAKNGYIFRLTKGVYLVPQTIPTVCN